MATFVHITDEKNSKKILANGISLTRVKGKIRGVYCFPVTKDFHLTHQWSRELRRTGIQSFVCVQFNIRDSEFVLIGKYNGDRIPLTASEAIGVTLAHEDPMGLEVIIERKIKPSEIKRIYAAPKLIGWRYYPKAKGKKPFCHCKYCNRGEIRAQRLIVEDD